MKVLATKYPRIRRFAPMQFEAGSPVEMPGVQTPRRKTLGAVSSWAQIPWLTAKSWLIITKYSVSARTSRTKLLPIDQLPEIPGYSCFF